MAVHCEDCLNFDEGIKAPHPFGPPDFVKELCNATENFQDSYLTTDAVRISKPKIINKDKNCAWFIPKEIVSSSSSGNNDQPIQSSSSSNDSNQPSSSSSSN